MRGARKGQASMEQLILAAIGIAFIAVLFYFSFNIASDSVRVSQARDMVQKLSNSADYMYSLGPGSSEYVSIYAPEGILLTGITNNTVHVRISLSSGESDLFIEGKPALIGEIPTSPGPHNVLVTHLDSHKVMFGNTVLSCSPHSLTMNFIQGQNGTGSILVRNIGEYGVSSINAVSDGNLADIMQFSQPASTLDPEENSSISLTFTIPQVKKTGSYSTMILVSGDIDKNGTRFIAECASTVTAVIGRSRPPDGDGPIITAIRHNPRNPTIFSTTTIRATADETTTGGGYIALCELELDGSGIWNVMEPTDGAYNDIKEVVTYSINPLPEGPHTVRVRCIDDEWNTGPARSEDFIVYLYTKEVLFVTSGSTPSSEEQLWMDWLGNHSSVEGFAWNYDVVSSAAVAGGSVNMSKYQVTAIANYNSAATSELLTYKSTGHYIVLLGSSMSNGPGELGISGGGKSYIIDTLYVNNEHYITEGYTIDLGYQITNGSYAIWTDKLVDAILVLSESKHDYFSVGEGASIITYGITRPDMMTADGDIFATRVFDQALLNS